MSNDLQQEERLKNELPKGFDDWLKYFKEVANNSGEMPDGGLSKEQIEEHDREWDEMDRLDKLTPAQIAWEKIEKELNKVKGPMSKAFEFDTEVTEKNMLGRTKTKVVSSKKGEHSDEKSFDTRTMAQFAKVQQQQQKEMMKYTEMMGNWERQYLTAGATPNEVNEYWKKMGEIVGENFLPNRGVDYVRLFYAVNPAMQEVIQEAKLEEEQNDTTHDDIKGKVSKVKKYAAKLIKLIPDEGTQKLMNDLMETGSTMINLTVDTHKSLTNKDSKDVVGTTGDALSFLVSNTAGEDVGGMFENMKDLFSNTFNVLKDGSEVQGTDENAPLDNSIKTLIEQYEKKKQLIDSANALFEKGIEVAQEFFTPLALLSTGKEFIGNILDACKWGDAFNKASDMMLIAESTDDVYQHPIAQRLLRQKIEISKATVDGVANLAKMVGQTLTLTPVGAAGVAVEKGAALLKKGAKFIFSRIDKRECKKAWKLYEEAQNSDDRIAKLKVFKHHAHMAFLAFAYGATVEKNTIAIQMCIDAGLSMENLEHKDTDLKIVAKFFALEGGDLDMTLQPEKKPGVVEKVAKVLADKVSGRKTSIAEDMNWQATDLSLTLTAFEKNCEAAEVAGWYASGTGKIVSALKGYEKAQKEDDGQEPASMERHFRAAYLLLDMLRQYSPTNQVGGQVHQGMNKYVIALHTKIDTEQKRIYKAWNESLKQGNTGWNADDIPFEFSDKYWEKVKKKARKEVGWEGKSVGLSSPLKKVASANKDLAKARDKKKTKDVEKYAKKKADALLKLMKKLQDWKESQPGMSGVRQRLIDEIQKEIPPEVNDDEALEQELQKLVEEGGDQTVDVDPLELEAEALSEDDQLMKELAELSGGEEARDELEDRCTELKLQVRKRGEDAKFFLDHLQRGSFQGDKKLVEKRYKEIMSGLKDAKKEYTKARKKYNKQLKEIRSEMKKAMKEEKKTNEQIAKSELLAEHSRAYFLVLSKEIQMMDEDFQYETEEAMKLSDQINDIISSKMQMQLEEEVEVDDEELEAELEKLAQEDQELMEEEVEELPDVPNEPVGSGQQQGNKPQKEKVAN